MIPTSWVDFYRDHIWSETMSKKPFPCKDVINKWMEDTTQTLQIRIAGSAAPWSDCRHQVPVLSDQFEYRIVNKLPELNLKFPANLADKWKYVAMDMDGVWHAYTLEPYKTAAHDKEFWDFSRGDCQDLSKILIMPEVPEERWQETLIKRP